MADVKEEKQDAPILEYGPFASILYYLFSFMDGYAEQTTSVCLRAFEVSLGLSPSKAAIMVTAESMALLGCCPFWGYLDDLFNVNYVLGAAMLLAGISSILLGCASNFPLIIFLRLLHGFSLASMAPSVQKIITESTPHSHHSAMFGKWHSVMCLGRLVSAVVTTYVSMAMFLGNYGWRAIYCIFGFLWIAVGTLVIFFMNAKPRADTSANGGTTTTREASLLEALKATFKTKTSWILLLATYVTEAPFGAFVYMITYLQYSGLSDFMAGVGCACILLGGFLGGATGGILIDLCQKKNHNYGRLSAGTAIIVLRLVFVLILFLGPRSAYGTLPWYQGVVLLILGASLLTISTVDRPILADIVEQKYQATATALMRSIGGILGSATFAPICGVLAEKAFGYIPTQEVVADMPSELKDGNATALRLAMVYVICVGTVINLGLYIGFFFTYPKDAKNDVKTAENTTAV